MKDKIKEELQELSPFLANLDKKQGLKTPEGYFEQFQEQVMAGLQDSAETKQKPAGKIVALFRHRVFRAAAAVAVLLVALFLLSDNKNEADPLAEITAEEAEFFLVQNPDFIDEEMLYNFEIEESGLLPENLNDALIDEIFEDYLDEMDDDALENLL